MKTKLIIIRGNSGSGKTTIAKSLQNRFGDATLLVSQDTIRRDMLKVRDRQGNLSVDLIRQITEYGKDRCEVVILEGILTKQHYEEMLLQLIRFYDGHVHAYYFDLPFGATVERHQSRPIAGAFGTEALRSWWCQADYLGIEGEKTLTEDLTEEAIVDLICTDVQQPVE